ncbi:membrane protein [Vibrio galatheae]|uniref:Membrane protein n=1 Tax=Vibrio galatheae TaxID=579748 RepID=A0A0F4NJC5_9VIBR|nr:porin [Vibrio galatheae]KJY83202.1 membrane protein [Vibrio galatheae]
MKKTLVALSVLMAATSAQAIELYNQDGVTVNLSGDVEIRYLKDIGVDQITKQEIDDADFGFDTRYAVNDDFQVGAYFEFSGDDGDRAVGNTSVGNVYFGFYHNAYGTLKVGKLDTILDDAGIGADYIFGVNSFFTDAGFGGDEAVRYDYDNGSFYAGLGLIQDKHDDGAIGVDGHYVDAKVGYRVAGFDFTVLYGDTELKGVDSDSNALNKEDTLIAGEVRYAGIENLNLELGYYNVDSKPFGGSSTDVNTLAVAADYTWNKVTFAGGFSTTDYSTAAAGTDFDQWFLNAGYGIAPNTTVYVEIGDNDKANTDLGYGVGIKASF